MTFERSECMLSESEIYSVKSHGNEVTMEVARVENVITIGFCVVVFYFDIGTKIPLMPFTSILPLIL